MKYDVAAVRKLVESAFDDLSLRTFCHDYFPNVYEQFADGQMKGARVLLLVEHAMRHGEIGKLLAAIKEANQEAYSEYASHIETRTGGIGDHEVNQALPLSAADEKTRYILVLAANPVDTDLLGLKKEVDFIRQRLREGKSSQNYTVETVESDHVDSLARYLLQYDPLIVHFSGHGSRTGEIILEGQLRKREPVSPEDLADLFRIVRGRTECVLLNACYTLQRASLISEQVSCVIGMEGEIDDESARHFAAGFYRALAFGKDYYSAFELGRNEIGLHRLPGRDVPRFISCDYELFSTVTKQRRVVRTHEMEGKDAKLVTPLYPLWFGTNRRPIDEKDISRGFSTNRDEEVHYGTCRVAVPESHRIGNTGSSWFGRLLRSEEDRLKLDKGSLQALLDVEFWNNVKQAIEERDSNERMALVFIHGYRVGFEEAAIQAAQIGFDLQVPGITAFYSWPSKGKFAGYLADIESIEASEQHIADFLTRFAKDSGAERLHIIAHSMGNRGLLRATQRVVQQAAISATIPFGQIFLAAPDVDVDVFRNLANVYAMVAQRTTLYVSSKDKALALSGIVHDYARAGYSPPVTVVPKIDTVEVSNVDLTFLGHGYYAAARDFLHDMHALMTNDTPPSKRMGLVEERMANGDQYWIIRA